MKKILVLFTIIFISVAGSTYAQDDKEIFKIELNEGDSIKIDRYGLRENYKNPHFFPMNKQIKNWKVVVKNDGEHTLTYAVYVGNKSCHHQCHTRQGSYEMPQVYSCCFKDDVAATIASGEIKPGKEKIFHFPLNKTRSNEFKYDWISAELYGCDVSPREEKEYHTVDYGYPYTANELLELKNTTFRGTGTLTLFKTKDPSPMELTRFTNRGGVLN